MGERPSDLASDPWIDELLGDAADRECADAPHIDRPDLVDEFA
jgi:hypothetical protein